MSTGGQDVAERAARSFFADGEADAVRICRGTSCALAGPATAEGPSRGAYCLGFCDRSPALLHPDGRIALGPDARNGSRGTEAPPPPEVRCLAPEAIITRRLGGADFAQLAAARDDGAYAALEAALRAAPNEVIDVLERSGERGRGGAGYATAAKWRACAEARGEHKAVVANGDEGDPGSFVDRVLLEEDPHAILEGMLLCGYAVGASTGIVFVRSEYPRAAMRMEAAVREAREAGLLGSSVLGSDFAFDVEVFRGMGSYVCGEETALLETLEGRRGEVRLRPPYPTSEGLYGQPTVVNNVETFVNVPAILVRGAEAYAALGTRACSGTKALCLNGGFARPGIVEVEFGISLRDVITDAGGGAGGRRLEAVLVGGPMGSLVLPADWDAPICYDAMSERGIQLGHGGIVALPEGTDFRFLLEHWLTFMRDESCGKCAPCSLGSAQALKLVRDGPEPASRTSLTDLLGLMEQTSLCAFGQLMPAPMRQMLDHFGDRIFATGSPT
jgi:NADH:ubiquinone oxidoreductase subunit F (NADH-binding)